MEKYPEKAKIISDNMSALSEAEKGLKLILIQLQIVLEMF